MLLRPAPFCSARARLPLLLAATTALLAAAASGCVREEGAGTSQSPLSIPPEGRVRVLARRITQKPDHIRWKWSLIGERNWRNATANGHDLALAQTYPLNSTTERGGCNIWEADLSVRRAPGGQMRWEAVLHGSDGTTEKSGGSFADNAPRKLEDILRIRQDRDAIVRLPADLTLATLDGKPVTLRVAR